MKTLLMTPNELTKLANQVKEVYLQELVKDDNSITQEHADWMNQYTIIISEKGYFGKMWDKLYGKGKDETVITVVKMLK